MVFETAGTNCLFVKIVPHVDTPFSKELSDVAETFLDQFARVTYCTFLVVQLKE